jgi:regulator of protease activity HflC (stomatin/prohibitin superfamily)
LIAFFLQDAEAIPYKFVGSYLWLIVFATSFFLGLFYFSQFILPLDWKDSWFEGLRLTIDYNFPLIGAILGLRSLRSRKRSPRGLKKGVLPKGFYRHNAGLIASHYSLVLSKETILTRSVDPGFVRLNRGEQVEKAVDLRQHQREIQIDALTRDGIPLKGAISVTFRVKMEEAKRDSNLPFPVEPDALFQLTYMDNVRDSQVSHSWIDQICQAAANNLISELSRVTFDELYHRDPNNDNTAFEQIHRIIEANLAAIFSSSGIDINDLTINYLDPPEVVTEQRIENWRADWKRRKRIREVEGEVRIGQRLQFARARAQIEIVGNIANSIEQMRVSAGVELSDLVALRMMEAMEEAISDDVVTSLVPHDTQETLSGIEQWLRRQSGNQDAALSSGLGDPR